eukprot:TRINITY_DN87_c4_g1_i2.p1 TRINITY_DN87_c4_g1~~TRINITY_DN87_c4_g1_i2.p1  ORF type:complete len:613 (+),score=64.79 TRINITY_DN87_c4_g1_i2:50-1888(+)
MAEKHNLRASQPQCTPPLSRLDPYGDVVLKRGRLSSNTVSLVRSASGGSNRSQRSGSGSGDDAVQKILRNRHHSKREAISWLRSANFKLPDHPPTLHSTENPLLNGTLALEIVAHCEAEGNSNIFLQKYTKLLSQHPKTTNHCRHLYSVILETVFFRDSEAAGKQEISKKTWNIIVEELLSGDEDLAWCFIWLILRRYPSSIHGHIRSTIQTGSIFQGYSHPGDMLALEACALDFLTRIGVIKCYSPPLPADLKPTETKMRAFKIACSPPSNLSSPSVLPFIRNGTLLCEIAEKVTYEHVIGVFQFPKIEKTCIINIKKAFAAMRNLSGMSKVYLSEQCIGDIIAGNPAVILPLLEDVMRYSDRFTPRRHRVKHGDIPYLGTGPASVQKQVSHPTPFGQRLSNGGGKSPLSERSDVVRSISPVPESCHSHRRVRGRSPQFRPEKVVKVNKTPPMRSATPPRSRSPPVDRQAADFFKRKITHTSSRNPTPIHNNGSGVATIVNGIGGYSSTPKTISPVLKPQDLPSLRPASPLASWVCAVTGVEVDFSGPVTPSFQDGTILAEMIRKLELGKETLPGIVVGAKKNSPATTQRQKDTRRLKQEQVSNRQNEGNN